MPSSHSLPPGLLDPWHGGGFLVPPAGGDSANTWISMPSGAHHVDLRGAHPDDPADITAARALERQIIRGWIDDYAAKTSLAATQK